MIVVKLVPFQIAGITPFGDLSELDFESINLLTNFRAGSSPSFTIVDFRTYIERISGNASTIQNPILPPSFLLSLSYRPHANTVLRLLSTTRASKELGTINNASRDETDLDATSTSSENSKNAFASLMLSLGVLYLQPLHGKYYPFQSTLIANTKHEISFIVSNGSMSSCIDGRFIEDSPRLALWDTETDTKDSPVTINFSRHLHSINLLVSPVVFACIITP